MFVAETLEGDLVGPADDVDGLALICPDCRETVIAKRGEIVEHHFAHLAGDGSCTASADPWAEKMTAWHRDWQRWFADAGCAIEVPGQGHDAIHRADAICPDGLVIEVQHSPIDVREIREREAFWSPMIWLWDAREIPWGRARNQDGVNAERLVWLCERGQWEGATDNVDGEARPGRTFKWRRPAISQAHTTQPMFWDCGDRLGVWKVTLSIERGESYGRRWYSVRGTIVERLTRPNFIEAVMAGKWSGVSAELRSLAGLFRRCGIGVEESIAYGR